MVEILAPAGSKEGLYNSILAGADAVYVGGNQFGARARANNLSEDELKEAIDFVHLHGKKLYLTVNTLLYTKELEENLYEFMAPLYLHGLDATIVQDLGVMSFLHRHFPGMDLHESTQMTMMTGRSANLLKEYGATRVVPARELSIEELRQMRKNTDLEMEVFVHGALCYCYSGQCLLSSVVGGRSGNRGQCAQPCRLQYENLTTGVEGFLLSPKDVCTLENIPDLVDCGIDSFKIEGRMKRSEYSALSARLYREYVDFYIREGRENYEREITNTKSNFHKDVTKLMDLYNRGGFCGGYIFLDGDKNQIIDTKRNNHYGVKVGTTTSCNGRNAGIHFEKDVNGQDVLEFRGNDGRPTYEFTMKESYGAGTEYVTNIMKGSVINKGMPVYRTRNNVLIDEVAAMSPKKVMLDATLKVREGKPVSLTVQDNEVSVTVEGMVVEAASKRPVEASDLEKRLRKTGETIYEFSQVKVDMEGELFLPLGEVNKLRRVALATWEQDMLSPMYESRKLQIRDKEITRLDTTMNHNEVVMVSVSNEEQLEEVLNHERIHMVVLPGEYFYGKSLETARCKIIEAGKIPVYRHPLVYTEKMVEGFECFLIHSWDALAGMTEAKNSTFYFDHNMYVTNPEAVAAYEHLGGAGIASPFDADAQLRRQVDEWGGFTFVYGRIPVMETKGCVNGLEGCHHKEVVTKICGARGDEFVVVNHCKYCYNTIYTKDGVHNFGDYQRKHFVFTLENAEEIREVLKEWKM